MTYKDYLQKKNQQVKQKIQSIINFILGNFGVNRKGQGIGEVIKNFIWLS